MKTEHRISHEMADPLLESFGESPKACMTNSSRSPANLKGKENPDLPSVCSNYWPPNVALSLCFNHLVLSTFRQCRSAIPLRSAKPIASIPSLTWLRTVPITVNNLFKSSAQGSDLAPFVGNGTKVKISSLECRNLPLKASSLLRPRAHSL
jgi:hypothetical protein